MNFIKRLPFILAILSSVLIGVVAYSKDATIKEIYLQMFVCTIVFYAVGLMIRKNLIITLKEINDFQLKKAELEKKEIKENEKRIKEERKREERLLEQEKLRDDNIEIIDFQEGYGLENNTTENLNEEEIEFIETSPEKI